MDVKRALLGKITDGSFALMTDEEIAHALRLGKRESFAVRDMLHALVREGELLTDSRARFGTAEQFGAVEGVFTGNARGFGFFTPSGGGEDLFIPARARAGAMHGDAVLALRVRGRSEDEGEILAVLSRGCRTVVGVYRREGQAGYLTPDDRRFDASVFIPAGKQLGCRTGDKAVAAINSYRGKTPTGEIVEKLGKDGDFFTEELALLRAFRLKEEFPEEAEREAERAARRPQDLAGREDFRDLLVITVDGEDTRDIDDAISLEKRDGNYLLGVHIADVGSYVPRGGALDREAFERGTSVYFPDRVLPMLPRALSNGICSLNEGEDRLTLSCLMTVDPSGAVKSSRITPGVIRSRHRMTYTEVAAIAAGDGKARARYPDLIAFTETAVGLTALLREARRRRGEVGLDVREAKIVYEDGKIDIPPFERNVAHEMIEEFMILANECVARLMTARKAPFVYRVHEPPSEEKARDLSRFLSAVGLKADFDPLRVKPKDYARILASLQGSPLFPLVNRVMLRSMSKARYSPENTGHFGLASECYCHFTSPIRRYPDLAVHRIIRESLAGRRFGEKDRAFVEEAARRSSECERNAAEAEREVDALYILAYMQDKIGRIYEATISGATSFGLFAELDNAVEGFLPLETLPEDYYELNEERHLLRGTKHSYALGERVRVQVSAVDWGARRVRFVILEKTEGKS